jgi:hypothetical protein
MKTTLSTERIIEVLDLLNNDQRPSTIASYIMYVISSLNGAHLSEIISFTQLEFELNLEVLEVSDAANQLVNEGQLVLIGEKYSLTEAAKAAMLTRVEASNGLEEKLKINFCKNASSLTEEKLTEEDLNQLFAAFKGYIHENFFFYGKSAIAILGNGDSQTKGLTTQHVFKLFSNKLIPKLRSVFYTYIETLASNSSSLELSYYESLADRAEHFFALGLSKELAQELASIEPIDWTIFVDTNFLLSVLKVRSNTENPAVEALLKIIDENKDYFKIKISYLRDTYKELMRFKPVLNEIVHSQKLTQNQIKAALQTDNLDGFARSYYQSQLAHGNATQHPATIIDQAVSILKSKSIEIYNAEVKGVSTESNEFIDSISDYSRFNSIINEARIEKGFMNDARYKGVEQIEHDIYLREAILSFREKLEAGAIPHFQDCKVFGLTLDYGLIDYDKYAGRRENSKELFIPSFLTPSYLLKKLYKLLPVQSDNYRKAFLSSIASPVFSNSDTQKSEVSQSALAVFHALGIDDMSFMAKSLKSQIFLNEIKNAGGDTEKIIPFVESELSKVLKTKERREKKLAQELKLKQDSFNQVSSAYDSTLQVNNNLNDEKILLNQQIEVLAKGLKSNKKSQDKLQSIINKISQNPQTQLPFSNEQDKQEIERLKGIVQQKEEAEAILAKQKAEAAAKAIKEKADSDRERFIDDKVRAWQIKSLRNLLLPILLLIILAGYLLSNHHWSFTELSKYISNFKNDSILSTILSSLITLSVFIYNAVFIKIAYDRCLNNSNIKAYRDLLRERLRAI